MDILDRYMTYLVSTNKVRVSGVDITGLHAVTPLEVVGTICDRRTKQGPALA